jgi:pimeloyl-ACP methyl ester carboxylesterase
MVGLPRSRDDPAYEEASVPIAKANGLEIAYDEFGARAAPVILLIMGLGVQLTGWRDSFCQQLADAGFRVLRYDNRDVGHSTKFDHAAVPSIAENIQRVQRGQPVEAPYTLVDMAEDAVGLLDALGIAKTHVVGVSMGGMIAQIVAANHPDRVSSLISIMSSSGRPGLPPGKPEAMMALMAPSPATDRESVVAHTMKARRVIGSPGYAEDEAILRQQVEASFDRSYYPKGMARQFAAILQNGSRIALLKTISVPSLVIHGSDDPLIPMEAGRDTAATIPGAELRLVPGMGHGLESRLEPIITDAIVTHCRKNPA